jgi:hypothetical protein
MGGACLCVGGGDLGDDRLFARAFPLDVFQLRAEALASCGGADSTCFRSRVSLSP